MTGGHDMNAQQPTGSFDEKQVVARARNNAYELMQTFKPTALATADKEGSPHVAIVYCVSDKDLNMYFVTNTRGRKYDNILRREAVSMVVMDNGYVGALQLSGIARILDSEETQQKVIMDLWHSGYDKLSWPAPPIKLFESGYSGELVVIKVVPSEMTYVSFDSRANASRGVYFQKVI